MGLLQASSIFRTTQVKVGWVPGQHLDVQAFGWVCVCVTSVPGRKCLSWLFSNPGVVESAQNSGSAGFLCHQPGHGLPSLTLVQWDDPIPSALTWVTSGKGFPHHHRFSYLFIVLPVVNVICLDGHRARVELMEQWYLWVRGKGNKDHVRLLARTQCWNCKWAGDKGGWSPSHSANLHCWPSLWFLLRVSSGKIIILKNL